MFSEMTAPPCEHVSQSHCPCLALATPLSKGSIYGYSRASAEDLQLGSHSGWPDSQDLALGTTGDSGDEPVASDIIPGLASEKGGLSDTQIVMPVCHYSALVCGQPLTCYQICALPSPAPQPLRPQEKESVAKEVKYQHLAHRSYPPYR